MDDLTFIQKKEKETKLAIAATYVMDLNNLTGNIISADSVDKMESMDINEYQEAVN